MNYAKCSHCTFLNNQLGTNLRTDHLSARCGKKNASVSLVSSMGGNTEQEESPSDSDEGEKIDTLHQLKSSLQSLLLEPTSNQMSARSCQL